MTNVIKKISKIIIFLIIFQIIFAIGNTSRAERVEVDNFEWDDIISSGDSFLQEGKDKASSGEFSVEQTDGNTVQMQTPDKINLGRIISSISGVLIPLGVAITVIVGVVLGVKFMTASAEDKAKVKESMIPYVAGCIVIYGAAGIWRLAVTLFSLLD